MRFPSSPPSDAATHATADRLRRGCARSSAVQYQRTWSAVPWLRDSRSGTAATNAEGTRLGALIEEQREAYRPFEKQLQSAQARAAEAWRDTCASSARLQTAALEHQRSYSALGTSPWLRTFTHDVDYLAGLSAFKDLLADVEIRDDQAGGLNTLELVTPKFFETLLLVAGQFEETLDVFGPPYAGQGAERHGGPHKQHEASADRQKGVMRFVHNIGNKGGDSYVAAALWSSFMRRSPGSPPGQGSTGIAQVRCFLPFRDRWSMASYVAPAHNKGGFGVFVRSSDLGGGNEQTEQDFRYLFMNESTSWYQTRANPAAPSFNEGLALNYGNQAPWFVIRPGRLYSMAVWCFGICDAHGAGFEQASFARLGVSADMPFCVVAQSKN